MLFGSVQDKEQKMVKYRTFHIYFVAVAVVVIALIYLWGLNPQKNTLAYELSKLLMQLLVVGLIGGAVKSAIDAHIKARDKRLERVSYYREVLQRIAKQYTDTKRIRRSLSAEMSMKDSLSSSEYKKFIDEISDIQLEFEMLNIELKSTLTESHIVYKNVKTIESYLKSIVKSFAERLKNEDESTSLVNPAQMSALEKDFLMHERNSQWYQSFILPIQCTRKHLSTQIFNG